MIGYGSFISIFFRNLNRTKELRSTRSFFLGLIIVTLLAFCTYFLNYDYPPGLFWDETFYIPSAEKYIHHIPFTHDQPPLGQMIIALGEQIINANPNKDTLWLTELNSVQQDLPLDFSFRGYRLVPCFLAVATAPILYLILLSLINTVGLGFLFTFFYIFDNAMIVHFRGSMLDGSLMFFILLSILNFISLYKSDRQGNSITWGDLTLGVLLGCCLMIKLTGCFMMVSLIILLVKKKNILGFIASCSTFIAIFLVVWAIHFFWTHNLSVDFIEKIIKNYQFMLKFHQDITPLDLCRKGENGSYPIYWIIGGKTISYRWMSIDDNSYAYLYLVSNPIVWGLSLLGIIISNSFFLSSLLLDVPIRKLEWIKLILGLWWSYMGGIFLIRRTLYLYHYFPGLMLGLILLYLCFGEMQFSAKDKNLLAMAIVCLVVITFQFYSPLTYYQPITDSQLQRRAIIPAWDLECARCQD